MTIRITCLRRTRPLPPCDSAEQILVSESDNPQISDAAGLHPLVGGSRIPRPAWLQRTPTRWSCTERPATPHDGRAA
jgi:hypothetical protein